VRWGEGYRETLIVPKTHAVDTMTPLAPADGEAGADAPRTGVTIPTLRFLGRRAVPQILDGVVIPVGLFLLALKFWGIAPAIIAGLGWEAVAMTRRLRNGGRVPGFMIVGAAMLVTRSVLALATGSTFVYFAQPVLGAALVAVAFLVSVIAKRPLARRFAGDYCVIPAHVDNDERVHSFMIRCSIMWAVVGFANTAVTVWLLLSQSTSTYVMIKTPLSVIVTVGTIAISVLWFRRTMNRFGLVDAGDGTLTPIPLTVAA
jgi:hypothetical protein